MGRCIQLLCGNGLEARKGIRWLVGSHGMPFTIVSTLNCSHLSTTGAPDFVAESDDLRILIPKGLEVTGVLVNEVNSLITVKKAGKFALKLISCLYAKLDKPAGVIVGSLEPGSSSPKYFLYTGHAQADVEALDDCVYNEKPSSFLWTHLCLLQCKLQLKIPLYASSSANPKDYAAQWSKEIDNVMEDLASSRLLFFVEGLAGNPRKSVQILVKRNAANQSQEFSSRKAMYIGDFEETGQPEAFLCSDFCSSENFMSSSSRLVPMPLKFILMLQQSMSREKLLAPVAEYLPASGETVGKVMSLNVDAVCLAHGQLSLYEAATSLVMPALIDQLLAMKQSVLKDCIEQPKLSTFHFCPPGFIHPISSIYDITFAESEIRILEHRRMLHYRLGLPLDRPLLRVANALSFLGTQDGANNQHKGPYRLCNVHTNSPSSGVVGGNVSMIEGSYEYYHYLQDNLNDRGWGCAYRSLQTIISWFRLQQYTTVDVPTHRQIQEILVEIGDKDRSFIGSQEWIGAIELSFVLDKLLGVSSKILNVRSGAELPEKCRELAIHFVKQGTPIMIGGGVLAYTLLGVDYNEATGDSAFLILDPHYTGGEDLKNVCNGGWCGWKKAVSSKGEEFFLRNKFYNLLLPQRPTMI